MSNTQSSSVDASEVARFAAHATEWWDTNGPLKTLHDINPVRLAWIRQFVSLKGLQVLDIGSGGGILSEGMAAAGANVIGLDVEKGAVDAARAHAKLSGLDIEYVCQPVEHFQVDKLFDAVTCLEMLEHVENPQMILEAAMRLVKPGGYVFLSTINRTAWAYASVILAAEYVLSLLPRQTHMFERFIKPSELSAMLRAVGLQPIDVTGLSYQPFTRKAALLPKGPLVNYLLVAQKPEFFASAPD